VLISSDPQLEAWLAGSAKTFRILDDREYRLLVKRWSAAFADALEDESARRGDDATEEMQRRLPASVFMFNGLVLEEVASGTTPNPCAYSIEGLESLDPSVINPRDLIVADADLSFAYVGTHEWQALSSPRFIESAG
jgi:hypothetical protein